MSSEIDQFYEVSLALVRQAGQLIRERCGGKNTVETKSCDVDLVTETDREVEQVIIGGISKEFPTHKFIGEEGVSEGGKCELTDAPTWVIDPVDGTMNFVHGYPHSCISLALIINKVTEIGIIYNPMLDQLFTAIKGRKAYLNGEVIHVSNVKSLNKALVSTETGTSRDEQKTKVVLENLQILIAASHGIRGLGSAALNMAMVALGGADSYFEFGIHIWDIAAGDLLVREAGGVSIDPSGGPLNILSRRILCASTEELALQLVGKIVQFYPPHD